MRRRAHLVVALAVVLVAAGCLGAPGGPTETTATDLPTATESPTAEPTTTPTPATTTSVHPTSTSSATTRRAEQACNGSSVAFYRLGEDIAWDQDRVSVGVGLGAGANVTLAVFENDTLLGTAQTASADDTGGVADGLPIRLKTALSGNHTLRVVAYPNTRGDGQFDPETATPCRHDGAVVRTESRTIDFSEFTDRSTPTTESPIAIDTTQPNTTPTEPTTASTELLTDSTSTSSETAQRTERVCNAVAIGFYGFDEEDFWDPDRVSVWADLKTGVDVTLAAFENDTLLGTTRVTTPNDTGAIVDGLPIPIDTELSGRHTIQVVMYANPTHRTQTGQFDPETATPCRHDGAVLRTESMTIDFSEFADDSTPTAEPPTERPIPTQRPTPTVAPDDRTPIAESTTTYPVEISVAEPPEGAAKERALAAEADYITARLENATCLTTWDLGGTVEERATVTNRTADSVFVTVTHPYAYSKDGGRTDTVADTGTSAYYVITSEGVRRVRGEAVTPC